MLVYSKMSPELQEFLTDELKDTDKLSNLNDMLDKEVQSIIDEFSEHVIPAIKTTIGILSSLRAKLKATISLHGQGSPECLGMQLNNMNTLVDLLGRHHCLCETLV